MTTVLNILLPALVSAAIAFVATPLVRRLAFAVGAIDHPGPRKVHREPMPRLGGLAVLLAVVVVLGTGCLGIGPLGSWAPGRLCLGIALGLLPILVVSIRDDIRPLPAGPKLLAQLAGALVAVSFGVALSPRIHLFGSELAVGLLALPLSIAWIVGVTNAFNLVDGLDGLSAGLALISSASLAAVFLMAGQRGMGAAALVLAGALLGFLRYNLHPARIFLGDSGATAIGFLLACFSLVGGARLSAGFAVLLPVLILGLPVAEALVSIARRLVRRASKVAGSAVLEADRNHIHHRLLALGLDHRRAVLLLYGVGAIAAGVSLLSLLLTGQNAALLLLALLGAGLVGLSRLGYEEFAVIRSGLVLRFYDAPVLSKALFVVFVDLVFVALSVWGAFALKYDAFSLGARLPAALRMASALAPVTVLWLWAFGAYRGAWRLAGVDDMVRVVGAVGLSSATGFLLVAFLFREPLPLSVFVIYALLKASVAAGSRASYRVFADAKWRRSASGRPVLLYGAGLGGVAALRELLSQEALTLRPIGFLDDDPAKTGRLVQGIPVLGPLEKLTDVSRTHADLTLVVTSHKIRPDRLRVAANLCRDLDVRLLRMDLTFRGVDISDLGPPVSQEDGPVSAEPAPCPHPSASPMPLR